MTKRDFAESLTEMADALNRQAAATASATESLKALGVAWASLPEEVRKAVWDASLRDDRYTELRAWALRQIQLVPMTEGIRPSEYADAADRIGTRISRDIEHREIWAWQTGRYRADGWIVREGWPRRNAYKLHSRKVTSLDRERAFRR